MNLNNLSLDQVDQRYRDGRISEECVAEYLRAWNAGPVMSQAVLRDGAIRVFDPETSIYRHVLSAEDRQRYGVTF